MRRQAWYWAKKLHPLWAPLLIIFLDRLLILWPYLPWEEANFYMRVKAAEAFYSTTFWTILFAGKMVLLYLFTVIIILHVLLCGLAIWKIEEYWHDARQVRRLNRFWVTKYVLEVVSTNCLWDYLGKLFAKAKEQAGEVLVNLGKAKYVICRPLGREEYLQLAKAKPVHTIYLHTLAHTPEMEASMQMALQLWQALTNPKQNCLPATPDSTASGDTGAIAEEPESAASVPQKRRVSEPAPPALAAPPATEPAAAEETASEVAVAEHKTATETISVTEALRLVGEEIAARNARRRLIDLPPLNEEERAAVEAKYFARVAPEELAAWQAQEKAAREPVAEQVVDSAAQPVDGLAISLAGDDEGGLVSRPRDDLGEELATQGAMAASSLEAGEPEDDWDDYGDEEAQVSPEQWEAALARAGGDPLVAAILLFMADREEWRGSPSELLALLNTKVPQEVCNQQNWPQTSVWLIRSLKEAKQVLFSHGLVWEQGRSHNGRWISLSVKA